LRHTAVDYKPEERRGWGTRGNAETGGNGNLTAMPSITNSYDVENRLAQAVHTLNGTEQYVYNPSNQRVWKQGATGSQTAYIYGPDGRRLATLSVSCGNGFHFCSTTLEQRLGGRPRRPRRERRTQCRRSPRL
jgi:hypothetical protein